MQKHAFLCQRNCIYVYVTRKVYHGTRGQIESVVDTPVDIGVSVLADMYNWQQLVCVMCPLLHSVWCEICFCGLILPVVKFSLITGLYVGMSNIQVSHLTICNTAALTVLLWLNVLLSLTIGRLLTWGKNNEEKQRLQNIPTDSSKRNKLKMDLINSEELLLTRGGNENNTNWCKCVKWFTDSWHYINQSIKWPKHKFALPYSFSILLAHTLWSLLCLFICDLILVIE